MRTLELSILVMCLVFAAAAVAFTHEPSETRVAPVESCERTSRGTHLCSADEHCGVGHKCCDGHCQMVDTCG